MYVQTSAFRNFGIRVVDSIFICLFNISKRPFTLKEKTYLKPILLYVL